MAALYLRDFYPQYPWQPSICPSLCNAGTEPKPSDATAAIWPLPLTAIDDRDANLFLYRYDDYELYKIKNRLHPYIRDDIIFLTRRTGAVERVRTEEVTLGEVGKPTTIIRLSPQERQVPGTYETIDDDVYFTPCTIENRLAATHMAITRNGITIDVDHNTWMAVGSLLSSIDGDWLYLLLEDDVLVKDYVTLPKWWLSIVLPHIPYADNIYYEDRAVKVVLTKDQVIRGTQYAEKWQLANDTLVTQLFDMYKQRVLPYSRGTKGVAAYYPQQRETRAHPVDEVSVEHTSQTENPPAVVLCLPNIRDERSVFEIALSLVSK
jgi:hypothetical protein